MSFKINDAEYDALLDESMPHAAKILYLFGIRPFMDYRTGLVGDKRKLSYQQLKEIIEFNPSRGSTDEPFEPSKQQIKRLINKLIDKGLLERLPDRDPRNGMVFRCVLASLCPQEERHMSDTGRTTRCAIQENPNTTPLEPGMSDTMCSKGTTQDERHTSGYLEYEEHHQNARTRVANFIPKTPGEWAQFFLERGWRLHEVQTKDTIPMFADWVRRQIDTAILGDAIQIAEAHLGRRPWGITYYGRVLEDVLIGRERYRTTLQTNRNRSECHEAHQRTHRKPESTAELHARLCEGAFGFGG